MKRGLLFLPLLVFLGLAALFWRGLQLDPQYMPSALIDRRVPAFRLPSVFDSTKFLTETDLPGELCLLNVWATWCPSCQVEHPFLNQLSSNGIRVIGVNYKDQAQDARQWLAQRGNPYEISIFDEQGTLGLDLGVTGAPETYLIDADGLIRFRYQGPLNESVWQQQFVPLIREFGQGRPG